MAGPYSQYNTDQTLELDGVWLNYGDFRVRVARAGGANQKYQAELAAAMRPYRRQVNSGNMDESVARRILLEVFCRTVILDWDSEEFGAGKIPGPEGEPLPFNQHNVQQVMTDLPDLFDDLRQASQEVANFRAEEIEDEVGKS